MCAQHRPLAASRFHPTQICLHGCSPGTPAIRIAPNSVQCWPCTRITRFWAGLLVIGAPRLTEQSCRRSSGTASSVGTNSLSMRACQMASGTDLSLRCLCVSRTSLQETRHETFVICDPRRPSAAALLHHLPSSWSLGTHCATVACRSIPPRL